MQNPQANQMCVVDVEILLLVNTSWLLAKCGILITSHVQTVEMEFVEISLRQMEGGPVRVVQRTSTDAPNVEVPLLVNITSEMGRWFILSA